MISFKEHSSGTYACLELSEESSKLLHDWCMNTLGKSVDPNDYHCTVMYSRVSVPNAYEIVANTPIIACPSGFEIFPTQTGDDVLVLRIESEEIQKLYFQTRQLGATYDYDTYKPHITLASGVGIPLQMINFPLVFDKFKVTPLDTSVEVKNKD